MGLLSAAAEVLAGTRTITDLKEVSNKAPASYDVKSL